MVDEANKANFHKIRHEIMAGLPITALANMFRTSRQNVRRKLAGIKPVGDRHGDPIYDIAEAAQCLVKPQVDLAAYIKTLRPVDVPVALQKQFWDGQNGRLKYMEEAGDLWRTAKVQYLIGELFKLIRQRVQLLADTVERQTGLTDAQRKIITGISDAMLIDLSHTITEAFKGYEAKDERDDALENGPPDTISMGDDSPEDSDDENGGL